MSFFELLRQGSFEEGILGMYCLCTLWRFGSHFDELTVLQK